MKIKYPVVDITDVKKMLSISTPFHFGDCSMNDQLGRGRFCIFHDDNKSYTVGALRSATIAAGGAESFGADVQIMDQIHYKNCRVIFAEDCPEVVFMLDDTPRIGNFIGVCLADGGEKECVVTCDLGEFHVKPEDVAYVSDIKFGIVEGSNG